MVWHARDGAGLQATDLVVVVPGGFS